jgi:hypothetical protein
VGKSRLAANLDECGGLETLLGRGRRSAPKSATIAIIPRSEVSASNREAFDGPIDLLVGSRPRTYRHLLGRVFAPFRTCRDALRRSGEETRDAAVSAARPPTPARPIRAARSILTTGASASRLRESVTHRTNDSPKKVTAKTMEPGQAGCPLAGIESMARQDLSGGVRPTAAPGAAVLGRKFILP